MKKIETKSIIVLVAISLVVALLLAGVNMITKPRIDAAETEIKLQSVKIVMPDGEFDPEPDVLKPDAPETVKEVYTEKNGLGYVVMLVTTKGYTGKEVITYQWQQNREYNLKGHFNFYYNITKNSVSRGSMFLYLILLTALGVVGNLIADLVGKLMGL